MNLHKPPGGHPRRSTLKKNRASNNLAKGLKSLVFDPPQGPEPPASYQSMLQPSPGSSRRAESKRPIVERPSSSSLDSGWDIVDDLPLRWATDYVPLAVPGSRLMNSSVFTYALWRNDDQPRSSTLLAVGVKSAVLLYESPKGERAFRFIKVSRTPWQGVKSIFKKSAFFRCPGILYAPSPSQHQICSPKSPRQPFSERFGRHQRLASHGTANTRTRVSP